jgi:hypothetical protein
MREALTMLAAALAIWACAGGPAAARCDLDEPPASVEAERREAPRLVAPVQAAAPAARLRPIVRALPPRSERREAVTPPTRANASGGAIPDSALMRKRRIL